MALVASLLGIRVTATVETAAEKEALTQFCHVTPASVLYMNDTFLPEALRRLTAGGGVDALLNVSATSTVTEELMACITPFGTVIQMNGTNQCPSPLPSAALRYISFDAAQLLQYRASAASASFKTVMSLLSKDGNDALPLTTFSLADAVSAFKTV